MNKGRICILTGLCALILGNAAFPENYTIIPFRMANNLIILDVVINGEDSVSLILDSGLSTSIIEDAEIFSSMQRTREISLSGLGRGTAREAAISEGNLLSLGGLTFDPQTFILLPENVMSLSGRMGTRINGLLSMQVFRGFTLEINYEEKKLLLRSDMESAGPDPEKYDEVPLQFESGKPFLNVTAVNQRGKSAALKLMLDTGASNALWIDSGSTGKLRMPSDTLTTYLGSGISGEVHGAIGRLSEIRLSGFTLKDVIVYYPDSVSISNQEPVEGRNGSIGSEILKRFHVVFDLDGQKMYLQPNRYFGDEFHHDMSGLEVLASNPDRSEFYLYRVREGSPAWNAGCRPGDRIIEINHQIAGILSLDDIYQHLNGPEGSRVRLVLLREQERMRLSFTLEDII